MTPVGPPKTIMPRSSEKSRAWSELDAAARKARLAAKLRANLARRKQQARARDEGDAPAEQSWKAGMPALDRKDGAA